MKTAAHPAVASGETQNIFTALMESMSEAVFVVEPSTGRVLEANPQAASALGYSTAELLTLKADQIFSPGMEFLQDITMANHTSSHLMRSMACRSLGRRNCCASCKRKSSSRLGIRRQCVWTCASSPLRTLTWCRRSATAASGKICTTGSTPSPFVCHRSESGLIALASLEQKPGTTLESLFQQQQVQLQTRQQELTQSLPDQQFWNQMRAWDRLPVPERQALTGTHGQANVQTALSHVIEQEALAVRGSSPQLLPSPSSEHR